MQWPFWTAYYWSEFRTRHFCSSVVAYLCHFNFSTLPSFGRTHNHMLDWSPRLLYVVLNHTSFYLPVPSWNACPALLPHDRLWFWSITGFISCSLQAFMGILSCFQYCFLGSLEKIFQWYIFLLKMEVLFHFPDSLGLCNGFIAVVVLTRETCASHQTSDASISLQNGSNCTSYFISLLWVMHEWNT